MTTPNRLATLPALFAAVLLALSIGACAKDTDAAVPGADADADAEETVPELEEIQVPTQAEADQQAAEEITPANADEEFEKLKQEIQGG